MVKNPGRAKEAVPVFAFCLTAFCGVLWVADALRIVELTSGTSDRVWFALIVVVLGAVGAATQKAFGARADVSAGGE
jgi:hypothetical protein